MSTVVCDGVLTLAGVAALWFDYDPAKWLAAGAPDLTRDAQAFADWVRANPDLVR
jgi:hypothetical protein